MSMSRRLSDVCFHPSGIPLSSFRGHRPARELSLESQRSHRLLRGARGFIYAEEDLGNRAGAGDLAFLPLSHSCAILEFESCSYKAGRHGGLLLHASQKLELFQKVVLQRYLI